MRFKKMFAIILCLIMVLLAAGCSQQENNETNILDLPTESDENDHETTVTTPPSTVESTVSNELIYYIWDTRIFSDGVAWVETCNKEDGVIVDSQWVCIDTNGDVLFMLGPDAYTPDEFENGVALYKTSDGICNVIDKNGTIVFSSKDGLFDDVIVHGDGYFAVYKYMESFDEAGYEILFLNSSGERVIGYTDLLDEVPELIYCGDGIFANCTWRSAGGSNKYTFINVKDDTYFEVGGIAHNNDLSNIFVDGVGLVELGQGRMNDVPALIYADGTVKELNITDYNYYKYGKIADGGFVFTSYYNDKVESVRFYDIATETVTELGNYGERVKLSRLEGLHFDNGHLLLPLVGADGKNYYTIIDKSGQSLFDPVACESAYAEGEDRIVVKYEDKTVVYNGKGETVFELPAGQSIDSYQSGMARLVGKDHSIQDIYIDLEGNILFDDEVLFTLEG